MQSLLDKYRTNYGAARDEEMTLDDYLDLCRKDPEAYATPAERMLSAIGEPEIVDTRNDPRLSRLFSNRVIKRYPAFSEFYGLEDVIAQIVSFFKHAAQGLEERKQVLYLLGPVGGGKSSIAERLKQLMEERPIYALKGSPVNESPLGLFAPAQYAAVLESDYGIAAALPLGHHVAVGGQAPAGIRRGHLALPRRARATLRPAPDRDRQDRAGRREQPGHLLAGRQGRHPQARPLLAERSRRLRLFRRSVPRQPGPARVRGDVQGPDQDAAPAAHRDAGRQLQGHRGLLGDSLQRHHPGALQRVRVADLPQQQAQRGVPRPHLHREGALLPAGVRGGQDLPEAPARAARSPRRRARRARSR